MKLKIFLTIFLVMLGCLVYISAYSESNRDVSSSYRPQIATKISGPMSAEAIEQLHHAAETEERRRKHEEAVKLAYEKLLQDQELDRQQQEEELGFLDDPFGGINFNDIA
ncbi:hypothetical protein KBC04_03640 [Candidatus Babeliales bacterium]|nr:hypothetical protein [Candidatus Babeliales bacterium]MBP9843855.1 hypothetical protein [Candidatus Babeliales bacterium]